MTADSPEIERDRARRTARVSAALKRIDELEAEIEGVKPRERDARRVVAGLLGVSLLPLIFGAEPRGVQVAFWIGFTILAVGYLPQVWRYRQLSRDLEAAMLEREEEKWEEDARDAEERDADERDAEERSP